MHSSSNTRRPRDVVLPYPPYLVQRGARFHPQEPFTGLFKQEARHREAHIKTRNSYIRVANFFSFVNAKTLDMVELTCNDGGKHTDLEMIAYVTPLVTGSRRAERALSGWTPLSELKAKGSVWGMEGEFARVKVVWPLCCETNTVGGFHPDGAICYILQHADFEYMPVWERTVADWAVSRLSLFESVALDRPRPNWMSLWTIQMIRLEQQQPRDVPGDWIEGQVDHTGLVGESRDDVSDAGSDLDSDNPLDLPNSHNWVPRAASLGHMQAEAPQEQAQPIGAQATVPDAADTMSGDFATQDFPRSPLFTDPGEPEQENFDSPAEDSAAHDVPRSPLFTDPGEPEQENLDNFAAHDVPSSPLFTDPGEPEQNGPDTASHRGLRMPTFGYHSRYSA
ncbi:hypothetical protein FRC06_004399 [Ceratobasidium sp. 370]|nr:hypothetical protein FRC06_004399 [Ceratobasidium sp. 370]